MRPFLALRSYLPDGHPDKAREIGSEATPAEFLDTLLQLTAEWGRVLAPHGSIAVELGDTYAGSGGSGGDYNPGQRREGEAVWQGSAAISRSTLADGRRSHTPWKGERTGWPLDKSLCGIPTLYAWSLAYGRNLLTGQESPAGMWRVRTVKPWIRSNPPVGALGDKERPATSYVIVATRARDRYFDLDAVRTASSYDRPNLRGHGSRGPGHDVPGQKPNSSDHTTNPAGAPPRDWWHHVDAVLDACLDHMAGKANGGIPTKPPKGRLGLDGTSSHVYTEGATTIGARGVHLRRALERAGILQTLEALDVSPKGYRGAHYAVWPPELVRLLVAEMAPRRVCTTCGQPSRRIIETERVTDGNFNRPHARARSETNGRTFASNADTARTTLGWSDCGHGTWRPGLVLDPFVGSGTTLAACSGMGRDSIGIDLDERNADLARERVGMFLEIIDRGDPTPCT